MGVLEGPVTQPPEGIDLPSWQVLQELLAVVPGGFHSISDIVRRREVFAHWVAQGAKNPLPGGADIQVSAFFLPRADSIEPIEVRRYDCTREMGDRTNAHHKPALIFIHGGGMVLGDLDSSDALCRKLANELPVALFSIAYRKAPEDPYPAAVNDCLTAVRWIHSHSDELGINPKNIGIYGPSAGGGLVLAVALKLRDAGEKILKYMAPIYAMIDDRSDTPAHLKIPSIGVWDKNANRQAWQWYLSGAVADSYAAPARAADLSGLPPCYSDVGTFDIFADDDLIFFRRLAQAGVPTEFHLFPGAFHGSENIAPNAQLSQEIWRHRFTALLQFIRT